MGTVIWPEDEGTLVDGLEEDSEYSWIVPKQDPMARPKEIDHSNEIKIDTINPYEDPDFDERSQHKLVSAGKPDLTLDRLLYQAGSSVARGYGKMVEGIGSWIDMPEDAEIDINPYYDPISTPPDIREEIDLRTSKGENQYEVRKDIVRRQGRDFYNAAKQFSESMPKRKPGSSGMFEEGVEGITHFVPGMLASIANPTVGTTIIYNQILGGKYGEYRKGGLNRKNAMKFATIAAIPTTAIEQLGTFAEVVGVFKPMAHALKSSSFIKKALGRLASVIATAGIEGTEESLQTFVDEFVNVLAYNPDATLDQQVAHYESLLPQIKKMARYGFGFGAVGGGILGGVVGTVGILGDAKNYIIEKTIKDLEKEYEAGGVVEDLKSTETITKTDLQELERAVNKVKKDVGKESAKKGVEPTADKRVAVESAVEKASDKFKEGYAEVQKNINVRIEELKTEGKKTSSDPALKKLRAKRYRMEQNALNKYGEDVKSEEVKPEVEPEPFVQKMTEEVKPEAEIETTDPVDGIKKIIKKGNIEKVALVKCSSYEQKKVDKAIRKSIELIGFKFKKGMKVLIKPNIVGVFPKNQIATTTHPSIIEAICKILKEHNCKIFIGESSFTNPEASFKKSGIAKIAKKYGKQIIFEQEKLYTINDPKAKILKRFQIAKIIKEVDLIIDVPKLKTHTLTKYTGAIKNLYGTIPGGLKQRLHNKAHGERKFSKLLVDIYQNIKPQLAIMDAVIGMEGEGPTSGTSKKSNLIIASKSPIALDIAATKIIGYKPKQIQMIKESIKRKLYPNYNINIVGLKNLPKLNFKKPTSQQQGKARKLIRNLFAEKPIICDTKKCIQCGMCAKHCPVQAITLTPYPTIDKKKCIKCFCCIEICPQNAMELKK